MAAPLRRPLLSLLLAAAALLGGVAFLGAPRAARQAPAAPAEASPALAAAALAGAPSEALAAATLGGEGGALGVSFLSWNAVWALVALAPVGVIFAGAFASGFLGRAETMLDVKARPGYKKREFRQPGQANPTDDKAPPDGNKFMPKINTASIITN
ncbi:unnamed protein product [Prorocentrum cordatum]|uniref:Uncharacterized protein n=1 Tax=Prorocentrum cordatum TaxID=2364126 RepID=A0ABN9Y403_9DINO|nr:unnamed protein product [Polarella glacialis]